MPLDISARRTRGREWRDNEEETCGSEKKRKKKLDERKEGKGKRKGTDDKKTELELNEGDEML